MTQFKLGWYANPIYGNGDYPEILKTQLANKAKEFGLPESPLPIFTAAEIAFNKGYTIFNIIFNYTKIVKTGCIARFSKIVV